MNRSTPDDCGECGKNKKSRHAKRCLECYQATYAGRRAAGIQTRRERFGVEKLRHWNNDACPQCGAEKTKKSKLCKTCSRVRTAQDFWDRTVKTETCWLWPTGTTYASITRNGRSVRSSRLAWQLANGPIPDGLFVCHRCDNPRCVRPEHLFLGTHKENMRDMTVKGRQRNTPMPGESHPFAKLTEQAVREIRAAVAAGESRKSVAARHGVAWPTVGAIVRQTSWRHVK